MFKYKNYFFISGVILSLILILYAFFLNNKKDNNKDLSLQAVSRENKKWNCGALCFFEICKKLDVSITLDEVEKLLPYKEKGTSMLEVLRAAKEIGLNAKGLNIDYEKLMDTEGPVIAFVSNNHFTIVNRAVEDRVFCEEPPVKDTVEIDRDAFENVWKGEILVITKGDSNKKEKEGNLMDNENLVNGPKIYSDELYYDFGKRSCFEELKHTFKVRNIGNKMLKFYELRRSSCDAMMNLSKWILNPEESTDLEITFYPSGLMGFQDLAIGILTNDKECPTFILHCYADLFVDLIVSPIEANFGNVVSGKEYVKEIEITTPYIPDFKIEKIDNTSGLIQVNADPVKYEGKVGSKWKLFVKLNTKEKMGHFKEWFILQTNHPRKKEIKIYAYGDVRNRMSVYPDRLSFGLVKKTDKQVSRTIQIYSNEDEFTIKEVKIPNNLLSYSISEDVGKGLKPFPAKRYEVTFVCDKELRLGKYNDKIEILTDNNLQPTIEIPFLLIACE